MREKDAEADGGQTETIRTQSATDAPTMKKKRECLGNNITWAGWTNDRVNETSGICQHSLQ